MPIKDKVKHAIYMRKYRVNQEIKDAKLRLRHVCAITFLNDPSAMSYMGYPIPTLHKEFYDRAGFKVALEALLNLEAELVKALNLTTLVLAEDVTVYIDGDFGRVYERVAIPPDKQSALQHFIRRASPVKEEAKSE